MAYPVGSGSSEISFGEVRVTLYGLVAVRHCVAIETHAHAGCCSIAVQNSAPLLRSGVNLREQQKTQSAKNINCAKCSVRMVYKQPQKNRAKNIVE